MAGAGDAQRERQLEPALGRRERGDLVAGEAVERDDPRAVGRDPDPGLGDEDVAFVTRDAVGEGVALGERVVARCWLVLPAVRAARRAPAP